MTELVKCVNACVFVKQSLTVKGHGELVLPMCAPEFCANKDYIFSAVSEDMRKVAGYDCV
jgi:hypothetical protein